MAATTMKTMTAEILHHWFAHYSPSVSGRCCACDKPLNGRDTWRTHAVTRLLIGDGADYEEFDICDRHRNLASAARKAWKRWEGIDRGPVKIAA
jgi:hypothetical protein